jgi:ankyrin repeat protein
MNILALVCGNSKLEMIRHIIQTYPDLLHGIDDAGWNAAHLVAFTGNVEILQLLRDNGIDVRHKSNDGMKFSTWHVIMLN